MTSAHEVMEARPLKEVLREVYAGHEILRRLGFTSEEIFVQPDKHGVIAIVLRVAGREMAIGVGRCAQVELFFEGWTQMATRINSGAVSERECQRMYYDSNLYAMRDELLVQLTNAQLYPINRDRLWS